MKLTRIVALTALGLGASLAYQGDNPAYAKDKPAKEADKDGGVIAKSFQIPPKGLRWGLSLEAIAKIYDKSIEAEMLPLFKKAEPGVELDTLSDELKLRQGELRRSRLDFGSTPTGVDSTALKGEYSYNNGESLATITQRSGTKRFFFFFNDRLWKVYDEHKLKAGGTLGADFKEAVKVLTKRFGVAPKIIPSDYEKGRPFEEAEWKDPDKVIRALDRGTTLAVVYADRKVQENLADYRKNKGEPGSLAAPDQGLDRDVQAAMKQKPEPPGPKDKEKDAKKKKK
jgi:hypothetical protein